MTNIRSAFDTELEYLTDLALRSKASASDEYDEEFIEKCRNELQVKIPDGGLDCIRVAVISGAIVGFCAVLGSAEQNAGEGELGFMFIEPEHKRKGIGTDLYNSAFVTAIDFGFTSLTIDSDPNAEEFYKEMGAIIIGEVDSGSIEGRKLTQFRVALV